MTIPDLTDQIIAIKAAQSYLAGLEKSIRSELVALMDPGDRKTGRAGGTKIGTVTLTAPEPSWRVTDGRAWREWVRENAPSEIVTVEAVNAAYEAAMLARGCDENGEPLPGMALVAAAPVIQVRPNAEALTAIVREYGSLGSRLAAIEAVSARGGAQ